MTKHHNQPDPQPLQDDLIAPALLDQALGIKVIMPEAVDELEAKVLALTDPKTLSLLDEALAPETANEQDLSEKIIAATTQGATIQASPQADVLGRIGFTAWRYAAAAAIVLATGIAVWFISKEPGTTSPTEVANHAQDPLDTIPTPDTNAPNSSRGDKSDINPDTLQEQASTFFADATSNIERRIQNVSDDLDNLGTTTIDQDDIWTDLDAYGQFLSDLETDLIPSAT